MVPTGTAALRQAQFMQAEEAAVGINLVIDSTDFVDLAQQGGRGTYDTFQIGWSGRLDPDGNIYQFVATTGSQNDSGYSNPRLDLILNNARKASTDDGAQDALSRRPEADPRGSAADLPLSPDHARLALDEGHGRLAVPGHAPPGPPFAAYK